jgi:hypothetical protein
MRGSGLSERDPADRTDPVTPLPQHPNQYGPQRPFLLTVDQELGEVRVLWFAQ